MSEDNERKEEVRHLTAQALGARFPAALTAKQLTRAIQRESDLGPDLSEIVESLQLLQGLGWVENVVDPLGITLYWRATASLALQVERGEI